MIYTITCNPSLDYTIGVGTFVEGALHRAKQAIFLPGGKGINVSQVLKEMNVTSTALGFVGGFTGEHLQQLLADKEIQTDFVFLDEETRVNVKLKGQKETEINASGPYLTEAKIEELLAKLAKVSPDDYIVLSGSLPQSESDHLYERIVKVAKENNISFIVDAEHHLLQQTLAYHPLFIKPNHHELGEIFGVEIRSPKDAIPYARKLLTAGAQSVIVSFGGEGALYVADEVVYYASSPEGKLVNSVGAGDSLVAGFLGKYAEKKDVQAAFAYGVAAGSATAFSSGLARREEIERLVSGITINDWSEGI